jgi:hypothetical protein
VTARRRRGLLATLRRAVVVFALMLAGLWWWDERQEVAALERTREDLRERLHRLRAADPALADAPAADLLIGMPVGFTTALARRLTAGLLDQVQISLRDITVHKEGVIRTKLLLGTIEPGRYALDLVLHEASAVLRPGAPRVDFQGRRLGIAVPVTLAEGKGRATVRLAWDSRGLGRAVCEDFSLVQSVEAGVVPRTYDVHGAFVLSVEDGALVARPDFPDLVLRIGVAPTGETWEAVAAQIEKRRWTCEAVIRKVNVPELLRERLEQGFEVRVPSRVFKPVRLPAAVQQSMTFEGRSYALAARFFDLRLTPRVLWYGADLDVRAADASAGN